MTSFCMSRRISGSRALNGSSKNSTSGSTASARARPTRCCWPPESMSGYACAWCSRPTSVSSSRACSWRAFLLSPRISSPKATLSMTRRCGSRPKCWNTIEKRWRRSSRRRLRVRLADVLAVEEDLAEGRLDQAGQAADERGLAGARQAHDHEDLAGLDLERDVAHGDRGAGVAPEVRGVDVAGRGLLQLVAGRAEDLPDALRGDRRRAVAPAHEALPNQPVAAGAVFS